ncbi:MAG: helix-turn-helix transcriptional regulator [Actinomycetota bacterium]|jgi:transcriptional regulator with XRE-family HTH domain
MSERRTTGSRVLAAREAKGLSLRRAARRLGVSPRTLRAWEHGREDIPFAVRQAMVDLYGIPRQDLVPDRPARAERDATNGTIRIGSVSFTVAGADDDSLRAFLSAVRQERGLAPEAALQVRESDAALLAEALGGTAEDIVRNLQRLLGVSEKEAVEFGRWMFRRTAIAGALAMGIAAGVVGAGALSASPPAASADQISNTASIAPPVDPNWAEIGDAAVLWNDKVPIEERN